MRVLVKKTLKEFWERYPDAEIYLVNWYNIVLKANWENSKQVIKTFPSADIIGNNRIVFNICHNKYRLIIVFRYKKQMAFVRFIGTHKEYDRITNVKNI